jgi:hypothetical protein
MMIGGEADVVKYLDPIFKSLAPGQGDIPRTPGREKLDGTADGDALRVRRAHGESRWQMTTRERRKL